MPLHAAGPPHETYIQSGPWPFAICRTCGWEGARRSDHLAAAEDAADHGEVIEQEWLPAQISQELGEVAEEA